MTELLPGVDTPSDAELISRVRGGDLAAYGELFSRHVEAARRLARQLMRGPDVDDLVSDAFAKTLNVLQGGGGPDVAFRAYLLTSVRRLHVDRIRASKKVQPSDDMTLYDDGLPFQDTVVASFENGAAAKAFSSLPERWQLVLWHLEVEGQKPADIAPLLGMTPNSVSALAYRAREGLRQAFLTMHLADCATEQCRWVNEHLGAYVRKGLSRRDRAKVEEHLQDCRRCTATYLELTEVNSDLAAIIAPLVLGAAAAAYISSASGVGITGVAALVGRIRDVVTAHGGSSAAAGSAGATAGGGATAGTAAGGAVATGSAVTAGGALTAGGVIAAGVAAVTTAALVFGGTPKEHITDADRSVGTVQTPTAAGAPGAASGGNAKQRTTAAGRSSAAATPGASPSASEVVVVAKAPEGTAPDAGNASDNKTAPQATDNPAQQGGKNAPAAVAPTIDLPGPLPGVPVPPISVPTSPGQSVPAPQPPTGGSQPSDSVPPAQQAGASGGGSQDGGTQNSGSTSGGTTQSGGTQSDGTPSGGTPSGGTPSGGTPSGGTPSGGTPSGGTPSGGADDHSPKGDTSHGNDGPTAAVQGSSGTASATTESAQPTTGEPAQQPTQPAGQPGQTQDPSPTDQPSATQNQTQQLPPQDATAQSTPDGTAPPQKQAAPTPLTIHNVRMTQDNLEFQITGHGELPRDVTVTVAEGTHGVAFVPDGASSTTSDSAVRDGDTLHVTIPLVLSVLPADARLFFTVSAGDGFTFVDSSGRDLQGAVQPTYDITATEPGASADQSPGQPSDTPSPEPAKATVDLTGPVPAHAIVDQSGRGQVTVTVHGAEDATLLAKPTPFRLVPADSSAATPYAQVTGVVPGATPGTYDVTFNIPPGHLDDATQWRLQISEAGPMTEPFELDVVPAYGSGGNGAGSQEQHRSPAGAGQFAADLGVRGLGNGH